MILFLSFYQGDIRQQTEESLYLRESLHKTREKLDQEKRLNVAIKSKKVNTFRQIKQFH